MIVNWLTNPQSPSSTNLAILEKVCRPNHPIAYILGDNLSEGNGCYKRVAALFGLQLSEENSFYTQVVAQRDRIQRQRGTFFFCSRKPESPLSKLPIGTLAHIIAIAHGEGAGQAMFRLLETDDRPAFGHGESRPHL